jgi:hypothetical protein
MTWSAAQRRMEARSIRPGNVVPDEKEEADYDHLECGAEEDGGESYPPWQRCARQQGGGRLGPEVRRRGGRSQELSALVTSCPTRRRRPTKT